MSKTYINYDVINDILNSTNIVDIVGKYISLKKKGSSYFGLCPFHNDTHPSLSVSPKKKIFKCFVCGTKGNVFNFVSKIENISYLEAVKKVAEFIGYDLTKLNFISNNVHKNSDQDQRLIDANVRCNNFYTGILYNDEYKKYLDYLYKRGLNDEIIKKFNLGCTPNGESTIIDWLINKNNEFGDLPKNKVFNLQELLDARIACETTEGKIIPFLRKRITFPIYDANNNLVAFSGREIVSGAQTTKYLHSSDSKIFHKGNILYNFNNIKNQKIEDLIIVEGFLDNIAFYRADIKNVIATMGTAPTTNHITLLQSLNDLQSIILCFDNDQAGMMATISIGQMLFENGLNVFVANYGSLKEKDADEIINKYGNDKLHEIINNRLDYVTYLINKRLEQKLPIDKLTRIVSSLIEYVVKYGDIILRSKHIQLIAQLSGLDVEDLKNKYQDLLKTEYKSSNVYVNDNSSNKIYEKSMKLFDENGTTSSSTNKKELDIYLSEYGRNHNSHTRNAHNALESLIIQSLFIPKTILDYFDDIKSCIENGIDISQSRLIKIINHVVKSNNKDLSTNELINLIQEYGKSNHNTQTIKAIDYLNELYINHIENNILEKDNYSKNIKKRINDNVAALKDDRYKLIIDSYAINMISTALDNNLSKDERAKKIQNYVKYLKSIQENYNEFLSRKKK